jgi:hypothetical protein
LTLAVLFQALLVGSAALAAGWPTGVVGRRAAARVGLLLRAGRRPCATPRGTV